MYASQAAQNVSRDAVQVRIFKSSGSHRSVQIFGGRGITRTGMGRLIEHASSWTEGSGYHLILTSSIIVLCLLMRE